MEQAIGQWTGDMVADAPSQPYTRRTRRWSLKIGRDGLTFSSTVERHGLMPPVAAERWRSPALAVAAIGGGLALLLAGATAGRAWSSGPVVPDIAMTVPAAKPYATPVVPRGSLARHRSAPLRAAAPVVAPIGEAAPAFIGMRRAEAVERALGTGEFQEWTDPDGTTGFAVAGPAETSGAATCRALAVLARQPDGKDAVTSNKVCRATN